MHNDLDQLHAAPSATAKAIAGLLALAVAMGIGRFAFTPVLPMMLQDRSLTIAGGSLLASANYLGYLVGALSAVALRVANDRAIRGGLLVIGMSTLAMGLPLGFGAWLGLRFAAGVASAWVLISVSAWCLDALAAYNRPLLNSMVFAGVGTGIASAGLLCIVLIYQHRDAATAWMLLGASALVVTALIWTTFKPAAVTPMQNAGGSGAGSRWSSQAKRLVVCYGVFGFGYIIPATFLPVMAKNALRDGTLFGWSWPVFGLAAALSTLAAAPLIRRLGNRRLWVACQFIMAVGVVLPVVWPHVLAVFAAALCVGGTFMVITLAAMQEAKRVAAQQATVLIAAMTSAFAVGQIIGPLTITLWQGGNGFSASLLLAAGLLVASAFLLRRSERGA